jgi:hypothetical protein
VVAGRLVRPEGNGFVLETAQGEKSFFPGKTGPTGRIIPNDDVYDDVTHLIRNLIRCAEIPQLADTFASPWAMTAGRSPSNSFQSPGAAGPILRQRPAGRGL